MDYHADRFCDNSLMFFEDDKLLAVLPASKHGEELRSHGGLTYGGIVCGLKMTTAKMLDIFDMLKSYMQKNQFKRLVYKRIPSVYHKYPSDEDLYALFRNNALLFRRDISTAIYLPEKIKFSDLRKRGCKKAQKAGLKVRETNDYETYIQLLTDVLTKYHDTKPVHTAAEISLLASRFPEGVKLFAAFLEEKMLAGVLIFDMGQTVHAQYIANLDEGRDLGALDLVMDYLINTYSQGRTYFDFGISTEEGGHYLNNGLITQKEMFGGRGIIYDFYSLEV